VSFWILFALSIYFWLAHPIAAFPPSLKEVLFASFGYNALKKTEWFGRNKNSNQAPVDDGPLFRRLDDE
jgi:hypothetical protein